MVIRHHLTDDVLMAYAAGSLPEAFGLVVASHVSLCDECRAQAAAYDALGGAVLEESLADDAGAEMDGGALDACLARLDGLPQANARAPRRRAGVLPAPLAEVVGDLSKVRWKSVGMGVKQAILTTDRLASARLLMIPGGAAMPVHGHRGTEMTLVLQGAFADATDRFGPGDVEIADAGMEHTPVAEAGEPCICLAASDAPLRFKGMIPRLAQPLFRI